MSDTFSPGDGRTYHGTDEMGGGVPAERGVKMPVRYLSFSPSVNAPKDDVIGTGAFLTIIGGFLSIITIGAWRRKLEKDKTPPLPESKKTVRTA